MREGVQDRHAVEVLQECGPDLEAPDIHIGLDIAIVEVVPGLSIKKTGKI